MLSEGPKPFKQPIVDSSVVVWVQPRQFERATVENEREWSPQIAFVSPSQPRVIKPRARAMAKVAEPPPHHTSPPPFPLRCPPRLRSNFAVKFERMPCKSRNRGQFRGNVNKYRCTLVSRATFPGYELMVNPAQPPSAPSSRGPTAPSFHTAGN